jgi:hypothetical protein
VITISLKLHMPPVTQGTLLHDCLGVQVAELEIRIAV